MSLAIEWVGLACFRLWQDDRPVLVMDPYTPSAVGLGGPDVPFLQADQVIVSSLTDRGHACIQVVEGNPPVINALDLAEGRRRAEMNGEPIVTVKAAEAPDHPEGADDNALYAFRAEDLWILHMGDLGYGLSVDQLTPFAGRCDVLLAIVGEKLTLTLDELEPMIEILQPKWVLPMHYYLPPIDGGMTPVEVFLKRRPRDPVVHVRHHTVPLPPPRFSTHRPTLVVLEPSGYRASWRAT